MRNFVRVFAALAVSLTLAACATPVHHNTPSGKVEVVFPGQNPAAVKSALTAQMVNRGFMINRDTDYSIVFDKPVTNIWAAALLGSQYDGTPNARVSYALIYLNGDTRAVADLSVITNPGSAFERRTDFNDSEDSLGISEAMNAARGQLASTAPTPVAAPTAVAQPQTATAAPATPATVTPPPTTRYSDWAE